MGCLTIAELYQQQLDDVVVLAGTRVTYYPVVLQGYSTATQSRSPSESGKRRGGWHIWRRASHCTRRGNHLRHHIHDQLRRISGHAIAR